MDDRPAATRASLRSWPRRRPALRPGRLLRRHTARADSKSAPAARCCGSPSSRRAARTGGERRARKLAGVSPWDLHAALRRLVQKLRGILPQAVGEGADVLGRGAALAEQALDLRQAVTRERADVLAG